MASPIRLFLSLFSRALSVTPLLFVSPPLFMLANASASVCARPQGASSPPMSAVSVNDQPRTSGRGLRLCFGRGILSISALLSVTPLLRTVVFPRVPASSTVPSRAYFALTRAQATGVAQGWTHKQHVLSFRTTSAGCPRFCL